MEPSSIVSHFYLLDKVPAVYFVTHGDFLCLFVSCDFTASSQEKKRKKKRKEKPKAHSSILTIFLLMQNTSVEGFIIDCPPPPAAFHTWLEAKLENGPWWHRDTSGSSQAMASHPSLRVYVQGCKLRGNVWASVQSESHTCPVRK